VNKVSGFVNTSTFRFYSPFVVDPGNGDRLLIGADRVYETTNGADLWSPISTPSTSGWTTTSSITAIGLAPSDTNSVYAATTGNHLFVTTNHGASWTDHPLPVSGTVADIQVNSANSQVAYAVISGFTTGGNVYRTTNGGAGWTNVSGNLPNLPAWSLQIDSTTPGRLYVGIDDGVYVTINDGANWSRFGLGLPMAQVFQVELNISLHILAAGTHGRGLWEIALSVPFTDDPLVPGVTMIQAVHITELRARIDALRIRYGLAAFSWTDPSLTVGVTLVRAQHILDLRTALAEAYAAAGQPAPGIPTRAWPPVRRRRPFTSWKSARR
jgi:hypothetical protein